MAGKNRGLQCRDGRYYARMVVPEESRYHRDRIVGRPVVYVVIDVFSHMITGIHVSFEGPSWVGAMEALSNAFLEKVEYCRRFGIDILTEEWSSVGMPERLLGDRGELAGRMVDTVTLHGIRFFGLFYSCPLAIEEYWFDKARQRGKWKIRMSYDPRCMDNIWLHGQPGQPRFIACALTDRSRHHLGKTLWEIDQLRQEARKHIASARPEQTRSRVTLISEVKSVVLEAESMSPDTSGLPKSRRTADIRVNRCEERQDLQRRDAIRAESPGQAEKAQVATLPSARPTDDYRLPDITELLRSFREDEEDDDLRPLEDHVRQVLQEAHVRLEPGVLAVKTPIIETSPINSIHPA